MVLMCLSVYLLFTYSQFLFLLIIHKSTIHLLPYTHTWWRSWWIVLHLTVRAYCTFIYPEFQHHVFILVYLLHSMALRWWGLHQCKSANEWISCFVYCLRGKQTCYALVFSFCSHSGIINYLCVYLWYRYRYTE